ncbi:MAG: 4Fe-4S binding protein [Campylobacter sp.]|nr:4Fe-4S binding protein [Campylobacter sp.]
MKPNIIEQVVEKDRCIGCGVCVAICPVSVLDIRFNKNGCYEVSEVPGCLDKCSLCMEVCPFYSKDEFENEISKELFSSIEDINFKEHLGYYSKTYEFSKTNIDDKLASASGGAGNYILSELLNQNLVDKVLAVESNDDPQKLFKFSVFESIEDLKRSRSSAYYPVTMDEILEYVLKNDARYAITVLPCFAKAIRLLQNKNHKFRNRVKFVIGLVCGQMKSKKFAQTLAEISFKKDSVVLSKVNFRKKQADKLASNFAFEFTDSSGKIAIDPRDKSPLKFWSSRAYTPFACNNCFDTFAITADVTLMDAWLPDKIQDYSGHSLIISRNKAFDEILSNAKGVVCSEFSADLVLKSQIGVVKQKMLFAKGSGNLLDKKIKKLKLTIQTKSNKTLNYDKSIEKTYKKLKILSRANAYYNTLIYLFKKYTRIKH